MRVSVIQFKYRVCLPRRLDSLEGTGKRQPSDCPSQEFNYITQSKLATAKASPYFLAVTIKPKTLMYSPASTRYDSQSFYRRCGRSGIRLPVISLGLWHNFGAKDSYENARAIARRAFDLGITHFDLANNYGPPDGSAEETFGRILRDDLSPWRDELIITTNTHDHQDRLRSYQLIAETLRP